MSSGKSFMLLIRERLGLDAWLWQLVEYYGSGWFRRLKIYAIIETGGKQYTVTPGQVIDVDYTGAAEGDTVELDKVLLIADGDRVNIGTPTVDGAKYLLLLRERLRAKRLLF